MKSFFIALFLSVAAFAGITDHQYDISISKDSVSIKPKKGFHLNQEAPAGAVIDSNEAMQKPTTKNEKSFLFAVPAGAKQAVISFYVCDDKKTVCEKHDDTVDLTKLSKASATAENPKPADDKKAITKVPAAEGQSHYDDIKNVSLKSTNGKPTLIVFSAPWCPACVRMMTEVYNQTEVQKQLSKVNFYKLNSDLPENSQMSKDFKIKAIPTLVLLDQKGNEAFRWLDYQTPKSFAAALNSEVKKVGEAASLLANAQVGDKKAAHVLGMRAFASFDFAEAIKWLSMTKNETDQKFKLSSEVSLAQEKADDDEKLNGEYLAALEKGIVLSTSQLDQLRWSIDYFDKKKNMNTLDAESKTKALALTKEIDELLKNPKKAAQVFLDSTYGEYGGFEADELYYMKSQLYKTLEMKAELQANNEQAIAHLSKVKTTVKKPGVMLNVIGYLKEAGDTKVVEGLYKQLIATYPTTYVYFEKYARFKEKTKNYDEALKLTDSALQYPAGNLPQLNLLKAQILVELNRKPEAAALIDETLKADYTQHERYKTVVKKLIALKEQTALKQ